MSDIVGVFDDVDLFTTYRAELVFRDRLVGGTPKDPKMIEGWIRSKMDLKDDLEIKMLVDRTMGELGLEASDGATFEDLEKVSEQIAILKKLTGFKVGLQGLYVEARQVKAMLKEAVSIVCDGEWLGGRKKKYSDDMTAGKLPKSYLAERVFVNPDQIWLGVQESTGIDTFIGHVVDRGQRRSTLGYYEFVTCPRISFDVLVLNGAADIEKNWKRIWRHAEENGFGAMRSQSFGRFKVVKWEKVE